MSINKIKDSKLFSIKKELAEFKERFDKEIFDFLKAQKPQTIIKYLAYYVKGGGKRIRPFIFYKYLKSQLNLNAFEDENLKKLMFAIEIYHNSLLILDDLEDKDEKRRNNLSLWKLIGENQTINIGFYGVNLVGKIINETSLEDKIKIRISNFLMDVTEKTLEGQMLDIYLKELANNLKIKIKKEKSLTEEKLKNLKDKLKKIYLKTITLKTAYYLTLPFLISYSLNKNFNEEELNKWKRDFLFVGIFFQIMNDFEDVFGKNNDLKEGILTLPYLILIEEDLNNLYGFLASDFKLVEKIKEKKLNKKIAKKLDRIKNKFFNFDITKQLADLIIKKIRNLN